MGASCTPVNIDQPADSKAFWASLQEMLYTLLCHR